MFLSFFKKNNLNYKIYFDTISSVAPIGIFLEEFQILSMENLYGVPTQKAWGVIFPNIDSIPRHPSQIYEALLEGLFLFIILNFLFSLEKIFWF